ncbi:centromere protein U isoform X1 [Molossus molossus]|uniref:Centromere protein U n=2 Tax=Molossus molossus TaxID=27622 RepID=A0A7J8GJ14_MOLMO|nr:centromere protein U isoform X1 [Molossus molossus]KAF6460094.1 centromere protein U [Molossus molossus]
MLQELISGELPSMLQSARYSKNTVGRTYSMEDKASQLHKPIHVYDFSDNSDISSVGRMNENEKDEDSYESFEPPLHSTAIYTDEVELSRHCGSFLPSTPPGKDAKRSSDTSEIEEDDNESIKISAKKLGRKLKPVSDDSESCSERDMMLEDKPAEKVSRQQHEATSSSELSEKSAGFGTPKKIGPVSAKSAIEKETTAAESQLKTQKKERMFCGKRKKSRNEARDTDISDCEHIWCLKGKKSSDIMDLDVVLSAFEKAFPEYKQNVESKICKEAINKFHSSMKEELIKMLAEVQMLTALRRKNAKMISDIEKKRQRLIEVQDELLWSEPQLKQLQIKYDELKEKKSSLRNAAYFLSNLKQLHQDYSDIQEREPNVKETYDSSSLPALLFKARTLLGAESHLQNINHQLEKLLDQK